MVQVCGLKWTSSCRLVEQLVIIRGNKCQISTWACARLRRNSQHAVFMIEVDRYDPAIVNEQIGQAVVVDVRHDSWATDLEPLRVEGGVRIFVGEVSVSVVLVEV